MDWEAAYWDLFLAHSQAWIAFTRLVFDTCGDDPYA